MKKIFFTVVFGIAFFSATAQSASPELISSSGESFQNSSYLLDWSIGECITATHSTGTYVLTQGFHQNTYVVSKVEDLRSDILISVYPNPTSDFISVDFKSSAGHLSVITITDINGKVLQQTKVINKIGEFDFSVYAKGVYFLTVKQDNKLIKSFKIIKN